MVGKGRRIKYLVIMMLHTAKFIILSAGILALVRYCSDTRDRRRVYFADRWESRSGAEGSEILRASDSEGALGSVSDLRAAARLCSNSRLVTQSGDRKKAGELCGSRLTLGLRIESRIPFVVLLSELFI